MLTRITLARSLMLFLSCISGCMTIGSDFTAPASPADATGYRHSDQDATLQSAQSGLSSQWWRVFNDAELDKLEQQALRDSPTVRMAAERILQAQAQSGLAQSQQSPTFGLGASVANIRSSATTPEGEALHGLSISGNQYEIGASLSYEIDLWGKIRRLNEAASAQALASTYNRDGVLLMLSSQIATAYWQMRGLDTELAIQKDAIDNRHQTLKLVKDRLDAGLTNEFDVLRATVESANAEAEFDELTRQRFIIEHTLAVLMGASPSLPIAASSAELPQAPTIPPGLPAKLLSQRPDLAESVALLRASNAQIGVAEGAFYPSIELTGSDGYASESLRNLTRDQSRQFSFGPLALSLPIFDGGRNRANLALAKSRYEEALANHRAKLLVAMREVEDALSDAAQRRKQGVDQAIAQKSAARAYKVALSRYEHGLSTYLEVVDAQRSALTSDRTAAQIHTQRLLVAGNLARALGGGWKENIASATPLQTVAVASH